MTDVEIQCCGIVHEIDPTFSKAVCTNCSQVIWTKESGELAREFVAKLKGEAKKTA